MIFPQEMSYMPTYDYVCQQCKRKFAVQLLITEHERGTVKCPKCKSKKVQQVPEPFFAVTSKKS